jgi:proline utilization trans-activator
VLRTSFVTDQDLESCEGLEWPRRPQALMLLDAALSTVGKCFHLTRISTIRQTLEAAYTNRAAIDKLSMCKLLAMFALGEVQSSRQTAENTAAFPGIRYFCAAKSMVHIIPERPTLEYIEIGCMFVCMMIPLIQNMLTKVGTVPTIYEPTIFIVPRDW